jgi:hypothetical protein
MMKKSMQDSVLRLLMSEPLGLSAPRIRQLVRPRISQPTLWRILDGLRTAGRITAEGRARATRYHASEAATLSVLRSRRLHERAARRLAGDPALSEVARERLQKLRQVNPHGRVYHDRWQALLDGPLPRLLRAMTEASEQSDAMRQESPFTVLVTAEERRRVFDSMRAA